MRLFFNKITYIEKRELHYLRRARGYLNVKGMGADARSARPSFNTFAARYLYEVLFPLFFRAAEL